MQCAVVFFSVRPPVCLLSHVSTKYFLYHLVQWNVTNLYYNSSLTPQCFYSLWLNIVSLDFMQILGSLILWHHVRAKELGSFRRITLIFVLNIWIVCPHTRDLRRIYQDKFVTCICLVGNNEICVQTLCISSQLRSTPLSFSSPIKRVAPLTWPSHVEDVKLRDSRRLQHHWWHFSQNLWKMVKF